jgi:hypothetical protein
MEFLIRTLCRFYLENEHNWTCTFPCASHYVHTPDFFQQLPQQVEEAAGAQADWGWGCLGGENDEQRNAVWVGYAMVVNVSFLIIHC